MRSSNRIIRGLDAAELPNWSVELIGSRYENPVDRMMAEIDRHQKESSVPPAAPTEYVYKVCFTNIGYSHAKQLRDWASTRAEPITPTMVIQAVERHILAA